MEYLSLYDFLGKAAGEDLGKEVASEARKQGIEIKIREISNPKFTGNVLLYPKDFLEFYFRPSDAEQMVDLPGQINYNIDEDDLPF